MPALLTLLDQLLWTIEHGEVEMALARNNMDRALVVCSVLAAIEDAIFERGTGRYLSFVSGDSLEDWAEHRYAPRSAFGIASLQFERGSIVDGGIVLCFNPRRITLLNQDLDRDGALEYKAVMNFLRDSLGSVLANVRPKRATKAVIDFKSSGEFCHPTKKRSWTIGEMISGASKSTKKGPRRRSALTIVDFDFGAKQPYVTVIDR